MTEAFRDDPQPFDLHAAAHANTVAGFNYSLRLQHHQAASLARSLRGIEAAARVLVAETGEDYSDTALVLGGYLRSGLIEAIVTMAANAGELLDMVNVQAQAAHKDKAAQPAR